MTAIQQAAEIYGKHGMDLSADLTNYLKFGYVMCTPDRLLLGRPIRRERGTVWLEDQAEADAWFVKLAVGGTGVRWFIEQMPYFLPFVAWQRAFKAGDEDLRIYQTERLTNFIYGKHQR